MNATHACAHLSAELEELETNGLDRSVGELGMAQADTTQSVDQHIDWLTSLPMMRRSANISNCSPMRFSASPRAQ